MNKIKTILLSALISAGTLFMTSCHKDKEDEPEKHSTEQSLTTDGSSTEKPSDEPSKTETFKVEFNTDGGTGEFETQTVEKGGKATVPTTNPEKEGYVFKGWFNGENEYDFEIAVEGDLKLRAEWYKLGKFSVNDDGKQVVFSPGNLQYNTTVKQFLFAASQTKCLGTKQGDVIDLFGWGMWLDEFAKHKLKITNTEEDNSQYKPELDNKEFKNNQTTVDGTVWFTLSKDEWVYLLKERTNASDKYGVARVGEVNGLILLPDEWDDPAGVVQFESGVLVNSHANTYSDVNNYTDEDWKKFEKNGAVFLPASGNRRGKIVNVVDENDYWSSTAGGDQRAYFLCFSSGNVGCSDMNRYLGFAVRLVRVL